MIMRAAALGLLAVFCARLLLPLLPIV